jgi:hypothetical protein
VIGGPIRLRCDQAIAVSGFAQEIDSITVPELQIERAFVDDAALENRARGGGNGFDLEGGRRGSGDGNQGSEISDERTHFRVGEIEGGHAAGRFAGAKECGQIAIVARSQLREKVGAGFTARGVSSVASGATALIGAAPGVRILGEGNAQSERATGKEA